MADIGKPLVSIYIPTYNAGSVICETLASILNQSYRNLEIHVVDNASTDNTLKVVAEFDDPRIIIHQNEINVGGEGNFNRCIQLATGKYTAIFHADDLYKLEMVKQQVAFLEANPEAGAVLTEADLINETGHSIGRIRLPEDVAPPPHLFDFKMLFKAVLRHSNFLICPSAMVRTDVYQQHIGQWRGEQFGSSADLDVWLRISQRYSIGLIPQPLMRYRISEAQYSAKVRQQTGPSDFIQVIDHYLTLEDIRALLDQTDLQNYARLERIDRVKRAVNMYLSGRPNETSGLLSDLYSLCAIKSALSNKRGLVVFIAGNYLKFLVLFKLEKLGRTSLAYMKKAMHK